MKTAAARNMRPGKDGATVGDARRHMAGQDPEKRRQILAGARTVFQSMGFDAASMNDITRATGVSKGTLYVYFENKEQLFLALIEETKERHRQDLYSALENDPDVGHALTVLGERLLRLLSQDWVLRAQRIVLGVTERMPDVGSAFFESGPMMSAKALSDYLGANAAKAGLDIPDTQVAAVQFLELVQAGIIRPRLYAFARSAPDDEQIARAVRGAVRLFMRGYARAPEPQAAWGAKDGASAGAANLARGKPQLAEPG